MQGDRVETGWGRGEISYSFLSPNVCLSNHFIYTEPNKYACIQPLSLSLFLRFTHVVVGNRILFLFLVEYCPAVYIMCCLLVSHLMDFKVVSLSDVMNE